MKWKLSAIKKEAIALYGAKHPEVSLQDLATVFRMTKSEVSRALIQHGVKRLSGKKSPAYVEPRDSNNRKHDHVAILAAVLAHPELRYRELGQMFGTDWSIIAYVAHKNGIYRTFRRSKAQAMGAK